MPRSKSQDHLYRTMQAYVRMDPSYTPDIGHLVFPNREEREREYQQVQAGSSGSGVTRSQPATPSKPRYKISDIFSRRSSKDKQQQSNNQQSMDEQQWRVGGGRFRQGARADSIQGGMMPTRTGRGRIGGSASMDRGVSRYRAGDGGGEGGHAPWYQAWHGAASSDQVAYTHAIQRQQSTFGGGDGRHHQRGSQPSSRRVSPNRIYDLTTTSTQSTTGSNALTTNAAARESNISVVQIRNSQDTHEISNHYSALNTNTRSYHGSRSNTPSGGRNTSAISMPSAHQQGLTKHQSLGSTSYGYAMQMFARESQSSGYDSADKPVQAGSGPQLWPPVPQDGDGSFVEFDTSLLSSLNVVHPNWMHSHQYSLDESNRRVKCAHIDAIGASRTGSRLADHGYVNETNVNRRVQRQMTELSQPSSSYAESQEIPVKKETPKQSPKKYDPPSIPKRFEEPTIPQHSYKVITTTTIAPPSAISPRLMQLGLPALFSPPPVTPILSPPLDFQDKDTPQPTKSHRQTFFRRSPLLSRSDAIRDSDGSPPVTPPPIEVKPKPASPANDESQRHKSPSPMKEQQKQLQQQLQEQKLQQQLQHQLLQHQFQEQEKTYRMTQTRSLEDTSAARRTQFIQKHGESSSSSSQSTQQLTSQVATFRSLDSCLTRGGMPRLSEMTTDSSIEIREDDADDEGNNSSSVNTIVRPQSRERISPSSRNSRVQYRAQARRSPGSSDNRASNCNSRDVSSSSDEDVLACSRSPSGTLSNTRRGIPAAPLRQGAQEETHVRRQGPSEESGYVRRSCSLQLPEIPTNFLGRLSPQILHKEVPSNPGSKRTSRCTTPQQQSIDYDMKREVDVVTEFVGASRCSAAAKSLLEDRIPNCSNAIIVTRENGPYINTTGRKAPQVPPRNCSLNKQQSQQIESSQANMPIYDTLDYNYLAQQQYQQQRYNQQQLKQQQQYWKQEYNRSQNLLVRSRLHQRGSPSPTKTLEAPVPSFQQRRLSPNTKSASADQHVTLPQRRSPIPITRSLNPSNSSSNSDVFLAASATNSPRPPRSGGSSGSSTPVLDYSDISVPKNYETVSFGDFARELIATRPGSAQSAITHQQHQMYQQQRGRAPSISLVQLNQQRSTSLPRTLSTIGDEGSVSDKTLTPTWQTGGTESQRSSPGGHRRRRRLQPNTAEAAQTLHTAPVSPLHETYRRRAVSPSAQVVDVSAKSSRKAHATPSQLDISARDQSREQSRNQSRAQSRDQSREQSPDNTLGKKRPSPSEDKSTYQRLAGDNKARQIAPAAKGGLLSSIKREFGRLGGRGGKGSASIDLGMNTQQREIYYSDIATIGDQAGPSKVRTRPKHQMSLDSTGRDVTPRGRTIAPPRTLSLNAAPVTTLMLQHQQQQSVDKPEGRQRFAAFGIGFMRSSKEKKKLNKSDRNKKCNSTDSGIQLEISGGDCTDDGCSHPTAPLRHNNTTLWSHSSSEHRNVATISGETSIIHVTRRPSTTSYLRATNVSIDEPNYLPHLQSQESIAPQHQCNGLYDHSEQHPQQHQSQRHRVSNESDKQLCSREGSSEDGNKTSGSIDGNELPRGSETPDSMQTKLGRIVHVESVTGARSPSRSRSRAKSGVLRPEKIRRIKASILSSPHLPIITHIAHHHPRHLSIRRTNSDLTQQYLRNLIYKKRYTSTAHMSSPTCAPIMGDSSYSIPCSTNNAASHNYVTIIDVNLGSNNAAVNTEVNGRSAAEAIVQLRRSSCAMWRNRNNRIGLGHPLRRSLSQPLDVDRLKEALVVVRGKRALRLHRSPTPSNHQHSSGGTTTPNGTTSTSAASTSAATTSDEEDNNSDTDDSVSYAERANQSLRQRRMSLEELPNTTGEALRENGVEEEQVVVLAEAVFDHVAIESEELAFKAGDVIEVQQTGDRNWWWGSAGGNTGWFPADRVRLRVSQEDTFEDCIAALQSGNTVPTPLRRRTSISLLSNDQVRTSVVRELVHTERDFVKVLLDVSEGYIAECKKRTEMFTSCQIDTIFLNIEEILRFQTVFLKDLEQCIDWDAPHKSCVGECFLKHRDGFTIYSHYCNGHTLASATLQELCQLNNYNKFFEACRLMRGLIEIPLHGYLLAPVQRICKYPLQLAELLKYTRSGHKDHHHVQQALTAMRDVATLINDRKRRMESLEKLQLWQLRVEGWQGPDLIDLSTQMIHQGEAKRISVRRVTSNIMLFLFDYQVIYCKKDILNRNSYTYKGRIPMDTTEIIDLPDGKELHVHMNVLNAIKLYSCVSDWFLLFCCRTRGDKQRWLEAFKEERRLVEVDHAARLHSDFLPAARHLARVAVRCQTAANNLPRKPTEKGLTNGSFRMNGPINEHSNSNSLGRRMGIWFTFGGNMKRKRYRPRDTD